MTTRTLRTYGLAVDPINFMESSFRDVRVVLGSFILASGCARLHGFHDNYNWTHDALHLIGPVAIGRPLRESAGAAAPPDERARLHAQARAGRDLLVHRPVRRRL